MIVLLSTDKMQNSKEYSGRARKNAIIIRYDIFNPNK